MNPVLSKRRSWRHLLNCAGASAALACTVGAYGQGSAIGSEAWKPTVLVRFTGMSGAQPGAAPITPPVVGMQGALYGVTRSGQANLGAYSQLLQGVAYRVDPSSAGSYAFAPLGDIGANIGTLVRNASGLVYGASSTSAIDPAQISGVGMLFSLDASGATLAAPQQIAFPAIGGPVAPQRFKPRGQMAIDAVGSVYMSGGVGTSSCASTNNYGNTLWRMDAGGSYARLVDFCTFKAGSGATEVHPKGGAPVALVWSEAQQALYGVSAITAPGEHPGIPGGDSASGVLFRIAKAALDAGPVADDVEILHVFARNRDGLVLGGESAQTALLEDGDWLYGTTQTGSAAGGAVWRIRKSDADSFTLIHRFRAASVADDGAQPFGPLVRAADGNIYGTTALDASLMSTADGSAIGAGSLFRVKTDSAGDRAADAVEVLHRFDFETEGGRLVGLSAGAVANGVQKLYGASNAGGQPGNDRLAVGDALGYGTVFSIDVALPTVGFTTALAASASTARVGDTLSLTWATQNAASCTAGGDNGGTWSGAQQTTGSQVPLSAVLGQLGVNTFTLRCESVNGGPAATGTVSVTVEAATPVTPTAPETGNGGGGGGGPLSLWLLAALAAIGLARRVARRG
ncbi:choice-of-anchor tandem repeat GloVer-containing protein [Pantoea sp. 18069]|uniref:choice-of-anchor tandem repeat GloVer-containing protein n=1 Tax=Pantoea sp. 18069 TaxID=2681415 RepID=UPI00135BE86A|nr:choice-of-anchor tandem repeat GloVer-containing protein [Pantoea sp. 18069]